MTDARASRARFALLTFLCLFTAILYLDRICMAQAVEPIQAELNLTNTQISYVLMSFTLAYGLFELPTGSWGDRVGARRVLTRISVWWSAFTVLTGACGGLGSLLVVRFLFGAGEAGAYPNAARVIARWFPITERGRVQGLVTFSALLGGTFSPVVAAYLITQVGWRATFGIFGLTGFVWAGAFWCWFRDDPSEHPAVNAEEFSLITGSLKGSGEAPKPHAPIPWDDVFHAPAIWLLGLSMSCSSFNSYLYFSWFPKYLQSARGLASVEAGWLASAVLGGGACGMLLGGLLVDKFCRRDEGMLARRRLVGVSTNLIAALLLCVAMNTEGARGAAAATALSFLAASALNALWWAAAIEVSGRHIGALFGLMNSMGVVGAMASQHFFGAFADARARAGFSGRAQWDPAFYVYMAVLALGAACWLFIDTSRPVGQGRKSPPAADPDINMIAESQS